MSLRVITLEELQSHQKAGDYWIVIEGHVHDVSRYLVEHPGGDEILIQYAGKDATKHFESIGHSDYANSIRKSLQVGVIDQETQQKLDKLAEKYLKLDREELEKHSKENDAWIVINDRVYDITEFIQLHPGGKEVLLQILGTDASVDFESVQHSTIAKQQMEKYLIGDYINEKPKNVVVEKDSSDTGLAEKILILLLIGIAIFFYKLRQSVEEQEL